MTNHERKIVENLLEIEKEVNEVLAEREDALRACIYALILRMHAFMFGPPGTAKSLAAKLLLESIEGASYFHKQLTRQMTEEAVFGPLNVKKWREEGEYEYNIRGGMADCQLARLEEYFDASDACIRSMNEVLNEREYTRSIGKPVQSPLHTAIATSNFWRDKNDAQAVADRFLCRIKVPDLEEGASRINVVTAFLENGLPEVEGTISFEDIEKLADLRETVEVDEDVVAAYDELFELYRQRLGKGEDISTRRYVWSAMLIQASAILDGRTEAEAQDIHATRFGLCFIGNSDHETAFEEVYQKVVGNIEEKSKSRKQLQTFSRVLDKVEAKTKTGSANLLVKYHQELMTIKGGFKNRKVPVNPDASVEKGFAEVEQRCAKLLEAVSKRIKPEDLPTF